MRLTRSLAEAADILGVHERTLRRSADAGDFPVIRVGGRRLVRVADLERLVGRPLEPADDETVVKTVVNAPR